MIWLCSGFTQGLRRVAVFHLFQSKEETVKYFQKNYNYKTTEDPHVIGYRYGSRTLTTGCVYILFKVDNFPISFWPQPDRKRCFCARCLRTWPFPYWKSTEILYQNLQRNQKPPNFWPLPGAMQINTYLMSKGPRCKYTRVITLVCIVVLSLPNLVFV